MGPRRLVLKQDRLKRRDGITKVAGSLTRAGGKRKCHALRLAMHNMHVTVAVNPLVLCALRSMLLRCSGAFALLPALLGRFLPRLRPLALRAAFFLPEKVTAFLP